LPGLIISSPTTKLLTEGMLFPLCWMSDVSISTISTYTISIFFNVQIIVTLSIC